MFGLILISAVTLMHVYVFWRTASVPLLQRHVSRRTLFITGAGLWMLFAIGRLYGHNNAGTIAVILEQAGMYWMAILFLATVTVLAADIATGFGSLVRRWAPSLRGAALICGLALSLVAVVQGMRPPVVQNYDVELPGLPANLDNTVIIGLSDLHIGSTLDGKWLEARVAQVRAEKPDIIVLLGDIFEGHGRISDEYIGALRGLRAPMGVWAVLGNHEFHGTDGSAESVFGSAGITVLRNEKVALRPGLTLAGIDDLTALHRSGLSTDLVRQALARPVRDATILLSHTPWSADRAAKAGAGLMLCGHTHGGQIWPFSYIVRLFYPMLAGRYDVDGMTVIVSRGAGLWGPRMRLWQPGEIIRVTLKARKKEARERGILKNYP